LRIREKHKAQQNVRRMYELGVGVPQDLAQAIYWYQNPAEQGHPTSQLVLGLLYLTGRGVPQDYRRALLWTRRASSQGYPPAKLVLGLICKFGKGLPADPKRAFKLFRTAAELGVPEAQFQVAIAYAEGEVVSMDIARAAEWFRDGAAQGHEGCQVQLCLMKMMGLAIPDNASLGRYEAYATAEANPKTDVAPDETESWSDESGIVSKEYREALALKLFENDKTAAGIVS
jgi:TPR repeat protein